MFRENRRNNKRKALKAKTGERRREKELTK
jgi:hypothetical protein